MNLQFKPKFGGRIENVIAVLQGKQVDAGITASATTNIPIVSPYQRYIILTACFQMTTPVAGGSAINLWLQKHSQTAGDVFFSGGQDIRGLNANQAYPINLSVPNVNTPKFLGVEQFIEGENFQIGGLPAQGSYDLFAVVQAAGTVTTQPVGLIITVEVAVVG